MVSVSVTLEAEDEFEAGMCYECPFATYVFESDDLICPFHTPYTECILQVKGDDDE